MRPTARPRRNSRTDAPGAHPNNWSSDRDQLVLRVLGLIALAMST
jgi:hypothetical protein